MRSALLVCAVLTVHLGTFDLAPAQAPAAPVRVLLFAGGPTREYQFCRRLLVQETERSRAVLSVCQQAADARAPLDPDVPAERVFNDFPASLEKFDLIIAIDPEWKRLRAEQQNALKHWVTAQGGALICVAGALYTHQLAAQEAEPLRDLLPVEPGDARDPANARSTSLPWRILFPKAAEGLPFLKLDAEGKGPFAGWAEFLMVERHEAREKKVDHEKIARLIKDLDSAVFATRDQASQDLGAIGWPAISALEKALKQRPSLEVATRLEMIVAGVQWADLGRGFHTVYPVRKVKPTATVLATFADPDARMADGNLHPYLVTMPAGKGKVVWLGSGELWRVRTCRTAYYDRFWVELARWACAR